jgi:hypothetical protein
MLNKKPAILVVPESESPEKLVFNKGTPPPSYVFWFGDNPPKAQPFFRIPIVRFLYSKFTTLTLYLWFL